MVVAFLAAFVAIFHDHGSPFYVFVFIEALLAVWFGFDAGRESRTE